jgi:two-component system NarL family sensor kinase
VRSTNPNKWGDKAVLEFVDLDRHQLLNHLKMRALAVIIVLFLTTFFCWQHSFAQNKELDILSVVLKKAKEDTNTINTLKRIVFLWTDINPDSAKVYINPLRSLSTKLDVPSGIIYADVKLAELYNMNGDYAEAMKLNTSNLSFASSKGTPYQKADVYKTIAMGFSMQAKNDSALHYYLQALKVYENNGDSLSMAKVMTNMAVIHDNMGEHIKAIDYCERSKRIFKDKDRNAYLVTLTNLALYQAYNKQYAESKQNYKEALAIAVKDSNYNSLAHIYSGLTDVAYWQRQYPVMITYAKSFEQIAAAMQNDYILLRAKLSMGKALFFNGKFEEAENYITNALQMSKGLEDNELLKDIYGMYSHLLVKKGDIKGFDSYRQKIDSISALDNKQAINRATKELETQYETAKKDDQIKLQAANIRQKQLLNYLLIGALIALVIIGIISYRNYRNKQKLSEREKAFQKQLILQLEQEKQLSATKAVLQGQDEERSRLAKDLHDGLGGMLSGVKFSFTNMKENMIMTPENQQAFARNMDMLDGIVYELRRVAHNMMPESLIKFGLDAALEDMCDYVQQNGAIKVNYQSFGIKDLSIDKNVAVNIYRIVQELLNNITKHSKATAVLVQAGYNDGHFSITVEDNGTGFNTELLKKDVVEKGIGWINIQNRVDSLKGKIDVQSSSQKGTSVFIEFTI